MKNIQQTSERPYNLDEMVLARYSFATKYTKERSVIDVGTGVGIGANYLAENGSKKTLGIDYSPESIRHAKRHFKRKNLAYRVVDVTKGLSTKEQFDVVIAYEIIEHMPKGGYSNFIQFLAKLVKKDGMCIVSTPNKLVTSPGRKTPFNPYHTREFTPKEFSAICKKEFRSVSLYGINCHNNMYNLQVKKLKKSLWYTLITRIGQNRLVRELLPLVPSQIKSGITGERNLPRLELTDFKISKNKIRSSIGLIAVCRKPKNHE